MTCPRCTLALCICDVAANRPTLTDYAIIALCIAVYAGAFAMAIWPPGVP